MKLNYIFVLFHYIFAIESIKGKLIRKGENNFRQLSSGAICESGTKVFVHYFEVDIFIEPDTFEVCSILDQIKLGNDINAILSSEVRSLIHHANIHDFKFTHLSFTQR
jgi:hypothetical protein